MRNENNRTWLLIITPLAFLLKDVVAAVAVLSTEPGITAKASLYYHIAMIPGILWFDAGATMLFDLVFGFLIGLILYLCIRFKKMWLLFGPPLAFLLKDTIATMAVLSLEPGFTDKASRYYSIAMLPGSLLHKLGDPMLFNVLFGALVGGILFLGVGRKNIFQRSHWISALLP